MCPLYAPAEGSIPAWAGKPPVNWGERDGKTVHPRVGGETGPRASIRSSFGGPSPRGRGNPVPACCGLRIKRSIPAWAGKPAVILDWFARMTVHPRVGGETVNRVRGRPIPWVHPRVGGETGTFDIGSVAHKGPSPRGRGNPVDRGRSCGSCGSIPAWAGKPRSRRSRRSLWSVHPRVGGETDGERHASEAREGPSPRGRGNPPSSVPPSSGPSPRGRGNLPDGLFHPVRDRRSIPAWAGKPVRHCSFTCWLQVHPRVGGETGDTRLQSNRDVAVHPRVGGETQNRWQPMGVAEGSIPAWAGKPQNRKHRQSP